uniref:Uncharacterized protein n=1 Tax=Parascaris equorum TaxID=6256 RepID=A0A914S9Z0_PAREQ
MKGSYLVVSSYLQRQWFCSVRLSRSGVEHIRPCRSCVSLRRVGLNLSGTRQHYTLIH